MKINLIVAVARNGVIGKDNKLPWRIPEDLKRFKQLTMGHVLIMGRKTYESIGKPLPGRGTIVLSRNTKWPEHSLPPGAWCTGNLDIALGLSPEFYRDEIFTDAKMMHEQPEVFICGGAEIYRETLSRADRLYLTRIDEDTEGDVYFPEWDQSKFALKDQFSQSTSGVPSWVKFETYDRIG